MLFGGTVHKELHKSAAGKQARDAQIICGHVAVGDTMTYGKTPAGVTGPRAQCGAHGTVLSPGLKKMNPRDKISKSCQFLITSYGWSPPPSPSMLNKSLVTSLSGAALLKDWLNESWFVYVFWVRKYFI